MNKNIEKILTGVMTTICVLFLGYMMLWLVWGFWIGIGFCK